MSKQILKKTFVGFMALTIFLWPLSPILSSSIEIDDNVLLKKLQTERLGQSQNFTNKNNAKKVSADNFQEKQDTKKEQKLNYVDGEVLVKFKEQKINLEQSSGRTKAMQFAVSKNLDKKEDIRKSNISVLKIKDSKTVEEKIAELKNDPSVEYVQPNFQYYPLTVNPNLWGLHNTGQAVNGVFGTNDKDIDAPEAWAISEGEESNIVVAVIDSGVAYNHPDLQANMWDGSSCSGLDKNGISIGGGCQHGYDYEDNDKIPLPTSSSHGTHIAGTIGAVKNGSGIIGVAPNVKIMAIKSSLTSANAVKGIDFAEQNGAQVINASWGAYSTSGEHYDLGLYNAIKDFSGLFIVAAGNAGYNHDDGIDSHKSYPDGFKIATPIGPALDNIIVVAATDSDDNLASFSDYGINSVDVGAPGGEHPDLANGLIYSTVAQESTVLFETFEAVTPPFVPTEFVATADWGTYDLDGGVFWGKVLYGDVNNIPYAQTANSTITSPTYDLSLGVANIDFWARCNTEYNTENWTDYMALEFSNNGGSTFTEVLRWDEPLLDSDADSFGSAVHHFKNISIPSQYSTSNFKFRFRWFANGNSDTGGGDGCLVDDIKITKFSDGSDEKYDYYQGTSMAAPHVAGLAALIWGYDSGLSYSEVRDVILNTGDDLASLDGKTTTGKRINAFNALNFLSEAPIITLIGSSTVNIYVGDTYTDVGATAEDDVDGDITANIIIVNPVDATATGTYIITYNVSDSAGNLADEIIRTVIVNEVLLESIEITNPATKLIYTVEEELDITGLEVTGFYNNNSASVQEITTDNITGFDSSATATDQILTITVSEKITTYTIDIIPIPDTTSPIITEVTPVQTPANDDTPEYTFNSTEAGTIAYSGLCVSDNTAAIVGDNIIIFNELADGIYDDCAIMVTDISDNVSNILTISDFVIDTTAPIVEITSPEDGLITNQSTTTIEWTIDGTAYSDDENLVEGENIIIRSDTDEVGNIGSSSIIIILDTTSPSGYTVDIDQDYININNQNKLSFTFADAEAGATYNYSIEHINGSLIPITGNGIISSATDQIIDIDVSTLDDGELVLFVYLIDLIGNQGHEMMNSVIKDTITPIVIITSPEDGLITNQSTATIEWTIDGTVYSDDEVLVEGENIIIRSDTDEADNIGSSSIMIILDTTPPTRTNGLPTGALSAGTIETTLSLTTDEDAVCRYATATDIEYNAMTGVFDITGSTTHSTLIAGLADGNSYSYYIKCQDELDNTNIDDYQISFSISNPAPSCGDGVCNGDETCSSCSSDCGSCPSTSSGGGGGGGSAPPADKTPPTQPTDFKANRENEKIVLTWKNPNDSDFDKILIVKSEESIADNLSIDDLKKTGKTIYEGNDEQYDDEDIDNNASYYYAIAAYDKKLNYTKPLIIQTMPKISEEQATDKTNEEKVVVMGIETDYRTIQMNKILSEAKYIFNGDADLAAQNRKKQRNENEETEIHNKYVARLIKGINGLMQSSITAFANFILYSTETTDVLGAGERAGVINSYKSAFNKLPTTESEWQDAIKIANGRWPSEKSEIAENNAKKEFKKVYKREANMENPNDNAAVTVIAYGLRPDARNMDSEKTGIKTFKHIYGYNPSSAIDWDVVRAIAYSGATR